MHNMHGKRRRIVVTKSRIHGYKMSIPKMGSTYVRESESMAKTPNMDNL